MGGWGGGSDGSGRRLMQLNSCTERGGGGRRERWGERDRQRLRDRDRQRERERS